MEMCTTAVKQGGARSTKVPRLYHRKSKTGCERCRARRVKCNEEKPACRNCSRHAVPCVYNDSTSGKSQHIAYRNLSHSQPVQLQPSFGTVSARTRPQVHEPMYPMKVENLLNNTSASNLFDIPESKSRRLLELRLLGNFVSNVCPTLNMCHIPEIKHIWSVDVPRLALHHDNLLHGILCISALHISRTAPESREIITARHNYYGLWLCEYRRLVESPSFDTAEAMAFSTVLFVLYAFTCAQERPLEPHYTPPTSWLAVTRASTALLTTSIGSIWHLKGSLIRKIVSATPNLSDPKVKEEIFSDCNRKNLLGLLCQNIGSGQEIWDGETREAYELTLSYVGSIQLALKNQEHDLIIARRLIALPTLVPEKFLDFVEQKKPRALVVLAHVFALAAGLENIWYCKNDVKGEIGAIQAFLPPEWQNLMRWPVEVVGLKAV